MHANFHLDFYENGYVKVDNLFNADEIKIISDALDRLQAKAADITETSVVDGTQFVVEGTKIHRIVWTPGCEPILATFGRDPRITKRVAKILDSNAADHLVCQAHFKIPGDEIAFAWHQDSENRGYGTEDWKDIDGRGSYVQTIVAIDEMTLENSPLMLIPKSHLEGHLALNEGDNRDRLVDKAKLQPVLMKPGSVLFFGPYLIHGSESNQSPMPRRIFINGFSQPGANFKTYPGDGAGTRIRLG